MTKFLGIVVAVCALESQPGIGEDSRCHCVFEAPSAPEPNRALLALLEKQLDRCGPEHQTCPACPACPEQQAKNAAVHSGVNIVACALCLLIGLIIGRFSSNSQFTSERSRINSSNEGDQDLHREHREYRSEVRKQSDDIRGELMADEYTEHGLTVGGCKLDGEFVCESRGGIIPEDGDGSVRRVDEEVEDEETLGIIDAGDEEWLEVHDVIREHSAVTIFNHTDSTWYVSREHPNFVRPLHGKRRHPLKHGQQRLTWQSGNAGPVSERVDLPTSREKGTARSSRPISEGSRQPGTTVESGGLQSLHLQRLQRRPRSAPGPDYGRTHTYELGSSGTATSDDGNVGGPHQTVVRGSTDSHQRCASADQVQFPAAVLLRAEVPRVVARAGAHETASGRDSPVDSRRVGSGDSYAAPANDSSCSNDSGCKDSAPVESSSRRLRQMPRSASPPIYEGSYEGGSE